MNKKKVEKQIRESVLLQTTEIMEHIEDVETDCRYIEIPVSVGYWLVTVRYDTQKEELTTVQYFKEDKRYNKGYRFEEMEL